MKFLKIVKLKKKYKNKFDKRKRKNDYNSILKQMYNQLDKTRKQVIKLAKLEMCNDITNNINNNTCITNMFKGYLNEFCTFKISTSILFIYLIRIVRLLPLSRTREPCSCIIRVFVMCNFWVFLAKI